MLRRKMITETRNFSRVDIVDFVHVPVCYFDGKSMEIW